MGLEATFHSLPFQLHQLGYVGCLGLSTYLMLVFQVIPSSFYTVAPFVLVFVLTLVIVYSFVDCLETRSIAQFVLELTKHHKLEMIPLPQAS